MLKKETKAGRQENLNERMHERTKTNEQTYIQMNECMLDD